MEDKRVSPQRTLYVHEWGNSKRGWPRCLHMVWHQTAPNDNMVDRRDCGGGQVPPPRWVEGEGAWPNPLAGFGHALKFNLGELSHWLNQISLLGAAGDTFHARWGWRVGAPWEGLRTSFYPATNVLPLGIDCPPPSTCPSLTWMPRPKKVRDRHAERGVSLH